MAKSVFSIFTLLIGIQFGAAQLHAQSVTYTRTIEADWSWFDNHGNELFDSFNATSSSGGQFTRDISVVGSRHTTVESIANVESNGKIRSFSGLLSDSPDSGNESFGSLELRYYNVVSINDMISVDDPEAAYVVMLPQLHGSITHDGRLTGPGDPWVGEMETKSFFHITESNSTGGDIFESESDRKVNEFNPIININGPVNASTLLYFDLTDGSSNLNLTYDEIAELKIRSVDAEGFYMYVENDFMSTFEIFANVYDSSGNLLDGVTVDSSLGHTYQNFNTVPEPSAGVFLLLVGGLAVGRRRRS